MLIFCIFWLPAMYVLWMSIKPPRDVPARIRFFEQVCALTLGLVIGIVRFFLPSWRQARGFGLSRFADACFDYVLVPVILPLLGCLLFYRWQKLFFKEKTTPDWTGWTLLSLIPLVLVCSIQWGTEKNPANLVLLPLLWSALALSITPLAAFYAKYPQRSRGRLRIISMIVLLLLASAVWWAFFAAQIFCGFVLLAIVLFPALLCIGARLKYTMRPDENAV